MAPGLIVAANPKRASESPQGYAQRIGILIQREVVDGFYREMETRIEEDTRIGAKRLTPAQQDVYSNVLIALNDTKKKLLQ